MIFSRDSSTWIWRRRPPLTVTAATPATRSRRGDRSFSAISRSVTGSKSPSTPMPMIGKRGRVELEDGRRVGVLGQAAAHAVDAGADFVGGFVEVGAPGEVQADVAVAFATTSS